jgi:hypothetical protein
VVAMKLGAAERRRRSSGHGKEVAAAVQMLAGGAAAVSSCSKIPNFCMLLAGNIGNNFLNNANFKFQTETKLKIL